MQYYMQYDVKQGVMSRRKEGRMLNGAAAHQRSVAKTACRRGLGLRSFSFSPPNEIIFQNGVSH